MALLGETIFWSRRRKSLEKLGSVPFGMGPISYFSRYSLLQENTVDRNLKYFSWEVCPEQSVLIKQKKFFPTIHPRSSS